jgi:antitoxin component of RelBE/YafQ-DinJ toxin-antitoxin module
MSKKIRVNITVDDKLLEEAKKKLDLFGGKLSTLFNAYLNDFVRTMGKAPGAEHEELVKKIKELEDRIKKLEKK